MVGLAIFLVMKAYIGDRIEYPFETGHDTPPQPKLQRNVQRSHLRN